MSVSSQIGQGTTVQLWLPAAGQVIDTSLRDRGEAAASDQLDRSAALRILLVDDDGLVRSGTAEMLDDLGHLVVDAETGSEALERLAACEDGFDLVAHPAADAQRLDHGVHVPERMHELILPLALEQAASR